MNNKIIIGSRESRLAVIQSMYLVEYIRERYPELQVDLITMKTTGDKILDRSLNEAGGKGLFVKELDQALRERRVDLTVHSLKDMPMDIPDDLPLLSFSSREDPRDVLVLPAGVHELAGNAIIGTSSPRRHIQLKALFPTHEFRPIRGNLQTRLRKLDEGEYGALVLAAAGLKRLGLEDRISRYFSVDELIPAAGQGILAVQGRVGEEHPYLSAFNCRESGIAAKAERSFVRALNGGCSSPVCAHAVISGESVLLRGLFYDEQTETCRSGQAEGGVQEARELGIRLAKQLQKSGGSNDER